MNTKLRKETKNEFEKDFFKLMNNAVFGKTMENVRKHRDIKLVTTDEKRNKLVSEPNYHTTKHFSENVSVIDMKKTKVIMNKLVYLGMSILDISKTLMYEFWYYYYDENDKRLLPIGKNKKVIGLFKDELGGKIMEEFCALRAKTYAYLINGYNDDDYDKEKIRDKKAKGAKKCVIKRRLIFENYKDCLFNDTVILRSQLKFKSNYHEMYTEEINKIALSSNDYKRLQTFDRFIK